MYCLKRFRPLLHPVLEILRQGRPATSVSHEGPPSCRRVSAISDDGTRSRWSQRRGFKAVKTGVGLAHRVGSFRPIAFLRGFGAFADYSEHIYAMQYQTLKNTIATLQKLRDAHYSQLDAGALAELDDVLRQLRSMLDGSNRREMVSRILIIADLVIRTVTNLTDWMK